MLLSTNESTSFEVENISLFKQKALQWANAFTVFCFLDSNEFKNDKFGQFEMLLAVDAVEEIVETKNYFEQFKQHKNKWLFGFFGYDLKNQIEHLSSNNKDDVKSPRAYFFNPRFLLTLTQNTLTINRRFLEAEQIFKSINSLVLAKIPNDTIELQNTFSKEKYTSTVEKIRNHISEGDVYEMNLCTEFYAKDVNLNTLQVFNNINSKSKAPFTSYLKQNGIHTLCFSPERFLKKEQNKVISQPIKGTIKKVPDTIENEKLKKHLQNDIKERAENVMIVDLVRNDLTKSAKTGTIKVTELFEIYEFATINQMISTVEAELREDIDALEVIKNAFPMGSMTGAPKVKAMQLIEQYETTKRGVYSGAIGYISPEQNFDFNVVIRSLNYNEIENYLSLMVGGAITYNSVPEKEWEEIQTKAKVILEALGNR